MERKMKALDLIKRIEAETLAVQLRRYENQLNVLIFQECNVIADFARSIKDCLDLPLKPGQNFEIGCPAYGSSYRRYSASIRPANIELTMADAFYSNRLELVLLWYWWKDRNTD